MGAAGSASGGSNRAGRSVPKPSSWKWPPGSTGTLRAAAGAPRSEEGGVGGREDEPGGGGRGRGGGEVRALGGYRDIPAEAGRVPVGGILWYVESGGSFEVT